MKRWIHKLLDRTSLVVGLGVLVLGVGALFFCEYETTNEKCTRCRMIAHRATFAGIPLDRMEETSFTKWYEATQPPHKHHWGWVGSHRAWSLRGGIIGCGGSHPVWNLTDDEQKKFVLKSSPGKLQRFYALLESADYLQQQSAVKMAGGTVW